MRLILLSIFFSLFNSAYGQGYKKNTDSLYNVVYSAEKFLKTNEQNLIKMCDDLYIEADDNHDDKEALRSITTTIQIYSELGDHYNVLRRIEKAINLAQEQKDYYRLSVLYTYLGRSFLNLGFHNKARKSFNIGLELSSNVRTKDSLHILKLQHYSGIAMIFEHSNPPIGEPRAPYKDSMINYLRKAYAEAKMINPGHPGRARWLGTRAKILGSVLISALYYDEGGKYLKEAENLLTNLNDKRFMISLYRFKGILAYNSGLTDSNRKALHFYNESLCLAEIYDIPAESYYITDALASLSSEMKMIVDARLFSDTSKKLKYEIEESERKAMPIAQEINVPTQNKSESVTILYLAILLLIVLSGFTIYYFYIFKRRVKNNITYNQVYETTDVKPEKRDIEQLLQMIKDSDRSFYVVFKQVFPDFQNKLLNINNELSVSDLELCAYLKLNLQTKEIALYRKNTISSVDNRKYRLRKKLNLPSDTNLYVWIDSI